MESQRLKSTLRAYLKHAAASALSVVPRINGLDDYDHRRIAYYCLSTHALENLNTFPLLVFRGQAGTGKSETLRFAEALCHRASLFSMDGSSLPVVRDNLAAAHNGTACVEEADSAWKDDNRFERLLSARYQRRTAEASHKEAQGDSWATARKEFFGATVVHRRRPFRDQAAMDGRSVSIRFRRKRRAQRYELFNPDDPAITRARAMLSKITLELPEVEPLPGVSPRVFNSYAPLIAVATLCGDTDFIAEVGRRLEAETRKMMEAQDTEPEVLVLKAIIRESLTEGGGIRVGNVRLSRLANSIREDTHDELAPNQVGSLARDLGFETKVSNGYTVVSVTRANVLRAAAECDFDSEDLMAARKTLAVEQSRAKRARAYIGDPAGKPSPARSVYCALLPSTGKKAKKRKRRPVSRAATSKGNGRRRAK